MAQQRIPCGIHIDWPCCGCETEVLTGEDALERMREEDDVEDYVDEHDNSMDGDFDSGMASAGHGTDEDYDPCGMAAYDDRFELPDDAF